MSTTDSRPLPAVCAAHDAYEPCRRGLFEAAHAHSLEVFDETSRRLATSDHCPADTDACRAADGSCDGSCRTKP